MNVDDVKQEDVEIPEGSKFAAMFKHQYELAIKYEPIERKNGFWHPGTTSPSIDDAKLQHFIKDMFWRVTEELAEAIEVVDCMDTEWKKKWDEDANVRHFMEEVADSLHFLIEASIYSQLSPASVDERWTYAWAMRTSLSTQLLIPSGINSIVMRMGLAANCLKNKPWKLTQMPTDSAKFRDKLLDAWISMCRFWVMLDCSIVDVYVLYMRKNAVNVFRQRTNY